MLNSHKFMIDKCFWVYYNTQVVKIYMLMEKSPSWSRAHDWKSCNRQKRFEGSNPSFSAKRKHPILLDVFLLLFLPLNGILTAY